jgi:hypothetical protein
VIVLTFVNPRLVNCYIKIAEHNWSIAAAATVLIAK